MQPGRRHQIGDRVETPRPDRREAYLIEKATELAYGEESEPRIARVVDPDAFAERSREAATRLANPDPVAEDVTRNARREPPREIQAPAVLDLEERAAARS